MDYFLLFSFYFFFSSCFRHFFLKRTTCKTRTVFASFDVAGRTTIIYISNFTFLSRRSIAKTDHISLFFSFSAPIALISVKKNNPPQSIANRRCVSFFLIVNSPFFIGWKIETTRKHHLPGSVRIQD